MRVLLLVVSALITASAQQISPFQTERLGGEAYSENLDQRLARAWNLRPDGYVPRTRHLHDDGAPRFTNRLFLESSPYLLQHAHNPVDWHPWSDEAFEKARRLGRPVLLSVGYSTCHWCHVMEEESFEDEEIARFINENYVAIKVDREQRPDIDGIYLAAVQAMTGRGGWPMTVWLNADREPFYGGTYFPPRDGDRGVSQGFLTRLKQLSAIFRSQPQTVARNSSVVVDSIASSLSSPGAGNSPSESALLRAISGYRKRFDRINGGAAGAPKFPSGLPVRLLLEEYASSADSTLLSMASKTLSAMASGGIHDHIGGGFHRYAVDARWRVPHFEKMLYDNALLAAAYIDGWRATGDEAFADAAKGILVFVSDQMTSPQGGFYSATDADSENPATGNREEGLYFTWTRGELERALGTDGAAVAAAVWSITADGDLDGRNVLRRGQALSSLAEQFEMTEPELRRRVEVLRHELLDARSARPAPLRDDKILTGWNGLMISAFAAAALAFDEPSYAQTAGRAARFILDEMRVDSRLQRSSLDGASSGDGYLDDYAFFIAGLIDLYQATSEIAWLNEAIALDQTLSNHFAHPTGGYFLTADDQEDLIVRQQPSYDGAEPSGNSVQAMNLLRLYEFTTNDEYRAQADRLLAQFSTVLEENAAQLSELLRALRWRLSKPKQILFVAATRDEARGLASAMRTLYVPHGIIAIAAEDEIERLSAMIPLFEGKRALGGRPTAYVCEERICKLPTSDPEVVRELLTP